MGEIAIVGLWAKQLDLVQNGLCSRTTRAGMGWSHQTEGARAWFKKAYA